MHKGGVDAYELGQEFSAFHNKCIHAHTYQTV